MANKVLYWLGEGVFTFKGKDYGYGKELPEGTPPETLRSLLKKKRIGAKVPTVAEFNPIRISEEVQGRLDELTSSLARATGENSEMSGKLSDAENLAVVLKNKLEAAEGTAVEFTTKLKDMTGKLETVEGAYAELTGLLEAAESNIAELTKQITKAGK